MLVNKTHANLPISSINFALEIIYMYLYTVQLII